MSDLREALQNASGFLDTPVARRKFGNDPFYADVVASIRAALSAQPQPEAGEAVAWQFQSVDGGWITFIGKFDPDYFIKAGLRIRPPFTAPPLAPDERMRKALRNIAEGNLGDAPGQANYARVKQVAHEALSRAREGLPPLSCDFAQSLPGGKLDDSTYGKIEDALDKIEAPAQDANGKWLSLHERIATICSPTEARMRAALERIAGSHWERAGYCQSDVEDVPDLTAEEAMREAREALSGAADASNAAPSRLDAGGDARARAAFIAAHNHLDLTEMNDAWGRLTFMHPHVESMWSGWKAAIASGDLVLASAVAAEREAIARIIDPKAGWDIKLDGDYSDLREAQAEYEDRQQRALGKADAIRALSTRAGG